MSAKAGLWLRQTTPPAGPPEPAHVDFEKFWAAMESERSVGINTPAMGYLATVAPSLADNVDQYGIPTPLSDLEQFDLDRLVAIMVSPYERGRALLHAGQLAPDEVDAIAAVFPDVLAVLQDEALDDMLNAPPPYPSWVEEVLGILFQKPASTVYAVATSKGDAEMTHQPKGKFDREQPTQAERRDAGVRAAG